MLASGPFFGRDAELAVLREQWEIARAGTTRTVVVTGEAGIGKSRLLAQFAVEVERTGGRVVMGVCYEDQSVPFQPFAQVLTAAGGHVLDDDSLRLIAGVGPDGGSSADPIDRLAERARAFDVLRRHFSREAEAHAARLGRRRRPLGDGFDLGGPVGSGPPSPRRRLARRRHGTIRRR